MNVDYLADLEFDGPICGPGSLTKIGAGTNNIAGSSANCSLGPMVVSEGIFLLNKPSGVTAVSGSLVIGSADGSTSALVRNLNSYQVAGGISVYPGGLMDVNGQTESVDFLELYGGAVQTGAGTLVLKTGGAINVYACGIWPLTNCFPPIISGHMDVLPGTLPINVNAGTNHAPDLEISARITSLTATGQVANLQKNGAGVLKLSGNNTFWGELQINDGAIIAATQGALGTNRISVNNGAMLTLDGGITMNSNPLTLNGTNRVGLESLSGYNSWSGPIVLSQPTGISVSATGMLQILGPLSGSGALTKLGPGTLQFRPGEDNFTNRHLGTTIVSEGVLEMASTAAAVLGDVVIGDDTNSATTATLRTLGGQQLSPAANVTVHSSGLFDTYTNGAQTVGTLVGAGKVNLSVGGSLSVSNNVPCTFDGVISGSGAFNKSGSALLQLTGTNHYTGITTILGGTLQVDGSQPQSLVQVGSGRLQGSGTVGEIDLIASSAVVAPSDSPGNLTCGSVVPVDSDNGQGQRGTLEIHLNAPGSGTNIEHLNVHGAVALSNITLNASLNFSSSPGNTFTIISNDGVDPVVGAFNGLPQGATLAIDGHQFQISYTGGDGNDVVLTQISGAPLPTLTLATPSPSAITLFWPTNGPAFTLQSSTNLSSSNWTAVSPSPVILGANYVVTNDTIGPQKFFRLINQ